MKDCPAQCGLFGQGNIGPHTGTQRPLLDIEPEDRPEPARDATDARIAAQYDPKATPALDYPPRGPDSKAQQEADRHYANARRLRATAAAWMEEQTRPNRSGNVGRDCRALGWNSPDELDRAAAIEEKQARAVLYWHPRVQP